MSFLAERLILWHRLHGRHHLPWQGNRDPYAVWLSEIMLQQTQVNTVMPYYTRFMQVFPTLESLAQAPLDAVLALWSGLGYYSRARHLHQAARQVLQENDGKFPTTREAIQQLPGIGRSTAAAIAVFAFGQREAILDGNVKRIFARYFGISGYSGETEVLKQLWKKAEESLPANPRKGAIETYTQALMDLGATLCTHRAPLCHLCPLQQRCVAVQQQCVDRLPATKPRKPAVHKETVLLFLMQQQKLLLQKRPSTGIWGELWCPPEIGTSIDAADYCRRHLSIKVQLSIDLPALDHQFTHFKLRIHPRLLHVVSDTPMEHAGSIWLHPSDALKQGIPAPVRTLLKQNFLTYHAPRNQEL